MKEWLWHFLEKLRKYFWCRFLHRREICHPEVWGRGLAGPWHCSLCRPCGDALGAALGEPLKGVLWDQVITIERKEKPSEA